MSKQYVMVTTISHFRLTYCISVEDLRQEISSDADFAPEALASQLVSQGDVEEFSQEHISEDIVRSEIIDEHEMLKRFDSLNDYLKSWTKEQKLNFVRNWRV